MKDAPGSIYSRMKSLKLKQKEDRRILRGHPWIFSNEIDTALTAFAPGDLVDVLDHAGRFVGRGYINPRSLIAVRLLTRTQEEIDEAFFLKKIATARELRTRLGYGESYRAIFSEGDGMPGLIVDKYADTLAIQSLTAGIDRLMNDILSALQKEFMPTAVVLRNDTASREIEGLAQEKRLLHGTLTGPVTIQESGILYAVDVLHGQKTGFFFDQRENRLALKSIVNGKRTLDCFCYVGAWSLSAARFGAKEVVGLDSSEKAVAMARENALLNGLNVRFELADVFDELRLLEKKREQFGCIILDPPAFVKSRGKVREALRGYKEINLRAMKLLEPGGALVTCSCSHHISQDLFKEMLIDAAYSAGRQARLMEMRTQARDHPILLAAKETQYLKCAILVLD